MGPRRPSGQHLEGFLRTQNRPLPAVVRLTSPRLGGIEATVSMPTSLGEVASKASRWGKTKLEDTLLARQQSSRQLRRDDTEPPENTAIKRDRETDDLQKS